MCVQSQLCERVSAIMFLVYGDESLDETQSRVCAVAGLVGAEMAWDLLEQRWKQLHGIIPFHANHCESDQGDYAPAPNDDPNQKHKQNQELYKASVILLAESEIGGFASAYDLAAQKSEFPPPMAPPVYYQPFVDVLQAMRNFAAERDDMAELTFDSRVESEHNAGLIYANLRENSPTWRERLAEKISFVSSRTNSRIQIADLFAREAMKALDNQVGPHARPIRKSLKCLQDTGRFVVVGFGANYFRAVKADMDNLCDIWGSVPQDYRKWLKERNRQDSLTNYFQFLQWHINNMPKEKRDCVSDQLNRYRL